MTGPKVLTPSRCRLTEQEPTMGPDLGRKTVTCACGAEVGMTLRLGPLTFADGDAHVDVDVTADQHTCPLDDTPTQRGEVIR